MGHYDSCRVSETAQKASKHITEQDKIFLLKHIYKNNGKIFLYPDADEWEWPTVKAMIRDKDNRILHDPQGGGYNLATVEINPDISEKEKTKILLS